MPFRILGCAQQAHTLAALIHRTGRFPQSFKDKRTMFTFVSTWYVSYKLTHNTPPTHTDTHMHARAHTHTHTHTRARARASNLLRLEDPQQDSDPSPTIDGQCMSEHYSLAASNLLEKHEQASKVAPIQVNLEHTCTAGSHHH